MQRRPQRASWSEDGRGQSPLGHLLSMPQQLRPVAPRASLVEPPHNLPSQLHYGPQEHGIAQSSQYTGGVSQNPFRPVQNQTADFVAPSYGTAAPLVGNAGAMSALAHALGAGGGLSGGPPRPGPGPVSPTDVRPQTPAGGGPGYNPNWHPADQRSVAPSGYNPNWHPPDSRAAAPSGSGFIGAGGATPQNGLAASLARGKRGAYGV